MPSASGPVLDGLLPRASCTAPWAEVGSKSLVLAGDFQTIVPNCISPLLSWSASPSRACGSPDDQRIRHKYRSSHGVPSWSACKLAREDHVPLGEDVAQFGLLRHAEGRRLTRD